MKTDEAVRTALHGWRALHATDEDGNPLGLADLLTPPEDDTVRRGLQEIESLADHVLAALDELKPTREDIAKVCVMARDEAERGKNGLTSGTRAALAAVIQSVLIGEKTQ